MEGKMKHFETKWKSHDGYALFGADLRGDGRSGGPRGHFPSGKAIIHDIDLPIEHAGE